MRRKIVTKEQINRIIRLRQAGRSYLRIEDEAGVPRRVAQRIYQEWEQSAQAAERRKIRRELQLKDLEEHRELLTWFSDQMVGLLDISRLPVPVVDAEEYLSPLWRTNRWAVNTEGIQTHAYPRDKDKEEKETQSKRKQIQRQNEVLFESLRAHTREKVCWESLDKWKAGWDACGDALHELRNEIDTRQKANINENPKLVGALLRLMWQQGRETIKDDFVRILWQVLIDSGTGTDSTASESIQESKRLADGLTGRVFQKTKLSQHYRDMLKSETVNIVEDLLAQLSGSAHIGRVANSLQRMAEVHRELAQNLNPLVLRPLILSTRCRICPV